MSTASVVVDWLRSEPLGWLTDDAGMPYPPSGPHQAGSGVEKSHRYDGGCAICRAGDSPEALLALVDRVLEFVGMSK